MALSFQAATEADIEILLRFHQELNEHDGTETDLPRARRGLQSLLSHADWGGVWLMQVEGLPVGYIALTWGFSLEFGGRDAFVDELYIQAGHRGQGIGRQALQFAESICRQQGIMALHLEVARDNLPAQALYTRDGFENRAYHFLMSKRLPA